MHLSQQRKAGVHSSFVSTKLVGCDFNKAQGFAEIGAVCIASALPNHAAPRNKSASLEALDQKGHVVNPLESMSAVWNLCAAELLADRVC